MNILQVELGKNINTQERQKIELLLSANKGISHVSISASGCMQVEWDNNQTSQANIRKSIEALDLDVEHIVNNNAQGCYNDREHSHDQLDFFGENTELYFASASGVFWILGMVLSFVFKVSDSIVTPLFIISAILGGVFTFFFAGE